ncbi:DUF6544 family protein [Pontibacter litorisediminis]|uniref:DUF6544 family protein n=1 Tax=Pontibacter litorisediminis TaxID=1846260 RepID=UPI0023EE1CAE|nr:DUF6544 family protein [Pontibacter litorisediminis]
MSLRKLFDLEARQALSELPQDEVAQEEASASLPEPVKAYLNHCGYTGKPSVTNFYILYEHAQIKLQPEGKWMALDCVQFNCVAPATRLALMQAKLFGLVPFGARDKYQHGLGNMLIKLAGIPVSNARGDKMNQAALVTFLAEAPLLPSVFQLQHTHLQEVAPDRVRASITDAGMTVHGEFRFNSRHEITSFRTHDRYYSKDGKEYHNWEWSALLDRYRELNGYVIPTVTRAVWHMPDGRDYEYFRASIKEIRHNITRMP